MNTDIFEPGAVLQYFDACGVSPNAPLSELKEKMLWGTYGPEGAKHPLKVVLLKDCSSDHLKNILLERVRFGGTFLRQMAEVIESLLTDRGEEIPPQWMASPSRFASVSGRSDLYIFSMQNRPTIEIREVSMKGQCLFTLRMPTDPEHTPTVSQQMPTHVARWIKACTDKSTDSPLDYTDSQTPYFYTKEKPTNA